MAEEILIDVAPNGNIKISTKGFKGTACKAATKALEDALGTVVSDVPTPEMHLKEQVRTTARG